MAHEHRDSPLPLLAFHHAGGSPAAFAGWRSALHTEVDVVPVALPGRGPDGHSTRYGDMISLTHALSEDLAPWLDRPHLMYGHSMGALVAYHLARHRRKQGARTPERLLLGAHGAPHVASAADELRHLPDSELSGWLIATSRVPTALLDGTDLLGVMLSRLRRDLHICASAPRDMTQLTALPCPLDVFVGADDPLVTDAAARAWNSYTCAGSTIHVVPGGHFFPRENGAAFFPRLRAAVAGSIDVDRPVTALL